MIETPPSSRSLEVLTEASPRRYLELIQDVKCFHCGFVSGQFVSKPDMPGKPSFRASAHLIPSIPSIGSWPGLRCARCGGPVFLDEVVTVVLLRDDWRDRPRRGRKPKGTVHQPVRLAVAL